MFAWKMGYHNGCVWSTDTDYLGLNAGHAHNQFGDLGQLAYPLGASASSLTR